MRVQIFDYSYTIEQREALAKQLRTETQPENWVYLQTCDRIEIYSGAGLPAKRDLVHLYRLVSGLESPLFGEKAIQGQVKQAYTHAAESRKLSSELHRLFQSALHTGKRVRRETQLDQGAMSHSSAVCEILKQEKLDVRGWKVCLIGAGKLSEELGTLLSHAQAQKIFLGNRSFEAAQALSQHWGGSAFRLDKLSEVAVQADLIISATRAPHFILRASDLQNLAHKHRQQLFIFDLAVPRDVDPEVKNLRGVRLWNITDIENQIRQNQEKRRSKEAQAMKIILEEAKAFYDDRISA